MKFLMKMLKEKKQTLTVEIYYYASLGVMRVVRVMQVLRVFHCFSSLDLSTLC